MRESYFSPDSILEKANALKIDAERVSPRNSIQYEPDRAALIIIDMQNYFLHEKSGAYVPSSPAIIPGIKRLATKFIALKRPIIFTRHLNTEENARVMSRWWRELIDEGSLLSEITDEFDTSQGIVVRKSQYDAFLDTKLESILKKYQVDQVVICGVLTHLCCETTARSAFMKGFEVFFTIDGTATYSEIFHRGAVLNLAHGFAKPVLVSDILDAMD